MQIEVTPEGRDGVWLAEKQSVIDFLNKYKEDQIHNFLPGRIMMGADWDKQAVIESVIDAERIAILTGESLKHNLRHALSVIKNNKLLMFDIGDITEDNLNKGERLW